LNFVLFAYKNFRFFNKFYIFIIYIEYISYQIYITAIFGNIETAKLSEEDTAKMEVTINDLKEKLSLEQEQCKKLHDDLSSYTERESKMSQSIISVSIFILE